MKIEIGSDEWKKVRREMITATDIAALMGLDPWCTPLKKYHEKVYGIEREQSFAMQRGLRLEGEARDIFCRTYDVTVHPEFIIHSVIPYFAASMDGISENRQVACEIKCPNGKDHQLALLGKIPEHYKPQLQWQMYVCGLPHIYYVSYNPEACDQFACILIARDDDFVQDAIIAAYEFYQNIRNQVEPSPSATDYIHMVETQFQSKEERLKELTLLVSELTKEQTEIKEWLIDKCEGRCIQGLHFRFKPFEVKGNVDYKIIPELKDVDLDKYRKGVSIRWRVDLI